MSMPWRSASCSSRRRSTTPGTTDVVANTDSFKHRFTFGGNEPRPGPDVPQLLLDTVPGYVVVNDQGTMSATARDAVLDAQEENLKHKREALKMERENMRRERDALHREKEEREAAQRQELQASWTQLQQEQGDTRRASVPAQTRRTIELQDRKIDDLKNVITAFAVDVRNTFAEITHAQRGHELGFNQFRAELRDLAGGMSQVMTKTRELESAMEDWTEQEGLETWTEEEQGDSTPGKRGEDDDDGAPDGAAKGKIPKKAKLADDPPIDEQEEEE